MGHKRLNRTTDFHVMQLGELPSQTTNHIPHGKDEGWEGRVQGRALAGSRRRGGALSMRKTIKQTKGWTATRKTRRLSYADYVVILIIRNAKAPHVAGPLRKSPGEAHISKSWRTECEQCPEYATGRGPVPYRQRICEEKQIIKMSAAPFG